jgi:hypothetical protein
MNTTRKKRNIQGEIVEVVEGWKKIRVYGKPFERGYAHGFLLSKELSEVKRSLPFLIVEMMKRISSKEIGNPLKYPFPFIGDTSPTQIRPSKFRESII